MELPIAMPSRSFKDESPSVHCVLLQRVTFQVN